MNNIEQKLNGIEKKLDEIRGSIQREDKPLVLRPNKDTPVNTIISFGDSDKLFFFKKIDDGNGLILYSSSPVSKTYTQALDYNCIINIEEDLRFRLFLNAPEGYNWGVVDKDGLGRVYDMDPLHGSVVVGRFDQYKGICVGTVHRRNK